MNESVKGRMKISVCVVDVKCRTGTIFWLGSVLWDIELWRGTGRDETIRDVEW